MSGIAICNASDIGHPRRLKSGFTLVELLVVIGIIALLIAILLPSLQKARKLAIRAACLSNLHQIDIYLQMYAQQYNGVVPLGWEPDESISMEDTLLYWHTPSFGYISDYVGVGLLFPANIISQTSGPVFYCPSNTQIPSYGYNVADAQTEAAGDGDNLWPTVYDGMNPKTPGGTETLDGGDSWDLRMGYSERPMQYSSADLSSMTARAAVVIQQEWAYYVNATGPINSAGHHGWILKSGNSAARIDTYGMPKISQLNRFAIMSDLDVGNLYTNLLHVDGSNVLYGDGSAHWVPRSARNQAIDGNGRPNLTYDQYLQELKWMIYDPVEDFYGAGGGAGGFDDQSQIWYIFDQQH